MTTYIRGYREGYEDGFEAGRKIQRPESVNEAARRRKSSRSPPKKQRKLTAHNRFMKKEMKALRKKHPRMKQPQIMKKANVAWRKHKRSRR
jgi:hypothetical protein